ncbi:hypothetical protein NL676_034376 [Syzygium grande]|nr:hypothetical protein NL676_034376 [Syzygium grande]
MAGSIDSPPMASLPPPPELAGRFPSSVKTAAALWWVPLPRRPRVRWRARPLRPALRAPPRARAKRGNRAAPLWVRRPWEFLRALRTGWDRRVLPRRGNLSASRESLRRTLRRKPRGAPSAKKQQLLNDLEGGSIFREVAQPEHVADESPILM